MPNQKKMDFAKIFTFIIFCIFSTQIYATYWTIESLNKIVDTKTMRPGSHDFFTRFDPPCLYDGNIVFRGFKGKKRAGIYTNLGGFLNLVIDTSTRPTKDKRTFKAFGIDNLPSVENLPTLYKNKIVFLGNGYGNGLLGIYLAEKGNLIPIADKTTVIPGGAKGLFINFSSPAFIDKENVIFVGFGENNVLGIYNSDKKNVSALVDEKTEIPKSKKTFQKFYELAPPRNNSSKDFAFMGSDGTNQFGLYRYNKGKLSEIAGYDAEIPKGTANFKSISNVIFDDKTNQVMFIGRGILGQVGIYSSYKNKLTVLVDQKTDIPEENDKFKDILIASMDNGKIAFYAKGYEKQEGVYLYTQNGLFKIMTIHDTINEKEIAKIELSKYALYDEQLALSIQFKNGEDAIYIAKLKS